MVEELEVGYGYSTSYPITISEGGRGTSYSGGSGSGAAVSKGAYATSLTSGAGSSIGGPGGKGVQSGYHNKAAIGGTGNPTGSSVTVGDHVGDYVERRGTGGLLIMYTKNLYNLGKISATGIASSTYGLKVNWDDEARCPGGASGGGSINIFANKVTELNTITAVGGAATRLESTGGAGGNGTVTINELCTILNYPKKEIELKPEEEYKIDESKLCYQKLNEIQTEDLTMGNIIYESLDESIVAVDSTGKITGVAEGSTKIKITDTKNDISTYIYVEVLSDSKVDVQEGQNFTIALKQNGTVWSYGLNDKGQLGIENDVNNNPDNVGASIARPTQIKIDEPITQISVGYSHSLALTKNGEIYSWGANNNGQLGLDDVGGTCGRPAKIEELTNIIKIDAYKNKSIALSSDGKVYVWGEGKSSLPMRIIFSEAVVDISGDLMLTEKGKVYNLANMESPIEGLTSIAKISAGTNHNLALDVEGTVYAWGTNTYGECGTSTTGTTAVRKVSFNILKISAGNCTSILQSEDGSIYVLGNNANGQIGLSTTTKATAVTKMTLTEDVEIENISAGEGTHSGLVDTNGFVWHTGLNTNGELGTGDNTNKNTFTKTGDVNLALNCKDEVYLELDETLTINSRLENSFNLKIDLIDDNLDNFEIQLQDTESLDIEGNTLIAKKYGTTNVTVTHIPTGKMREIEVIVMKKMKSIVQGFRDTDLPDGEYEVYIEGEIYTVELINYYDDVRYSLEEGETSKTVSLGDDSTDYKTLVVKYHGDLTIDEGVTLTANTVDNLTYKKGMYICVLGDIYNNGEISMTARGTYNCEGEDVYLWKNIDNSVEYVPALGGVGGAEQSASNKEVVLNGKSGTSGIGRQTGGGGTGGRKKLQF